jgi:predicted lipoprotein with Yx(FWY)xxD motif
MLVKKSFAVRHFCRILTFISTLWLGAGAPHQAFAKVSLKAKMFELGSDQKKLLYTMTQDTEITKATGEGAEGLWTKALVSTYVEAASGETVAVEKVRFQLSDCKGAAEAIVSGAASCQEEVTFFSQDHRQMKSTGEIKVSADKVDFQYTAKGKTKESSEALEKNFVISSSVVSYLKKHWKEIKTGKTVKVRFGVLDRQETVGFEFFKTEDINYDVATGTSSPTASAVADASTTVVAGEVAATSTKAAMKSAIVIKMKPSSFIISALVNPLYFTMTEKDGVLLAIKGRTVPKLKSGSGFTDLDVETTYEHF